MDLAPLVLNRPKSVLKLTSVPSGAGAFVEVTSCAVIVVELTPSANSDVAPATSVMLTTGPAGGGGGGGVLGGGVLGGGVLGGGVLGGVVVGGDSSAFCPLPPTFSHPAKIPTHETTHTDISTQPHLRHPRLCRTYGYLLL
jgi:hypothetical protein